MGYQDKDKNASYARAWRRANPEAQRRLVRRSQVRRYSMEPEELEALTEEQDGLCYICHVLPVRTRLGEEVRGLSIDHDHSCCPKGQSCGECLRGLICNECNRLLGMVGDSIERLEALVSYLKDPPLRAQLARLRE